MATALAATSKGPNVGEASEAVGIIAKLIEDPSVVSATVRVNEQSVVVYSREEPGNPDNLAIRVKYPEGSRTKTRYLTDKVIRKWMDSYAAVDAANVHEQAKKEFRKVRDYLRSRGFLFKAYNMAGADLYLLRKDGTLDGYELKSGMGNDPTTLNAAVNGRLGFQVSSSAVSGILSSLRSGAISFDSLCFEPEHLIPDTFGVYHQKSNWWSFAYTAPYSDDWLKALQNPRSAYTPDADQMQWGLATTLMRGVSQQTTATKVLGVVGGSAWFTAVDIDMSDLPVYMETPRSGKYGKPMLQDEGDRLTITIPTQQRIRRKFLVAAC